MLPSVDVNKGRIKRPAWEKGTARKSIKLVVAEEDRSKEKQADDPVNVVDRWCMPIGRL